MKTKMKAAFAVLAVLAMVFTAFAVQGDSDALNADSKLEYFGADSGAYAYMYDSNTETDSSTLMIVTGFVQTNLYAKINDGVSPVMEYDPLPASAVVMIDAPAYKEGHSYTVGIYEHIDSSTAIATIPLLPVKLAFQSEQTENIKLDDAPIEFTQGIAKYEGDLTFGKTFEFKQIGADAKTHIGYIDGLSASAPIEDILAASNYDDTNEYYLITLIWSDSQTFSVKFDWNTPQAVKDWNGKDDNTKRFVFAGTEPDRQADKDVSTPQDMLIDSSSSAKVPTDVYGLEGYEFAGWFTKPIGGTQATQDVTIYEAIKTDIELGTEEVNLANATFTLYAQWTARSYTFVYTPEHISQGRTAEQLTFDIAYDQVTAVLNPASLSDIVFEAGYIFNHWTNADGSLVLTPGDEIFNLDTTFGFPEGATEFQPQTYTLTPVYDYAVTFVGIDGFDINVYPYATEQSGQATVEKARASGYEFVIKNDELEAGYLFKAIYSDMLYSVDPSIGVEGAALANAPEYMDGAMAFELSTITGPVTVTLTVEKLFNTVTLVQDDVSYTSGHAYYISGMTADTPTTQMFEIFWSNTTPAAGYGILQIKQGSEVQGTYQYDLINVTGGTVEQIRKDTWKLVPTGDMKVTFTYQEGGADVTDFYLKSVVFDKAEGIIKSYEGSFADGQVQANGMAFRTDADSGMVIYSLLNNRCTIDFYEINIGANDTEPGAQPTDFGGHDAYLFEIKPIEGYSLYALTAQFTAGEETVETALALVDAA